MNSVKIFLPGLDLESLLVDLRSFPDGRLFGFSPPSFDGSTLGPASSSLCGGFLGSPESPSDWDVFPVGLSPTPSGLVLLSVGSVASLPDLGFFLSYFAPSETDWGILSSEFAAPPSGWDLEDLSANHKQHYTLKSSIPTQTVLCITN